MKSTAKRNSIGHGVMFYLGPVFRLAGGVGTYMFVPAVYGSVLFRNFSDSGDLLLVMYFIFFGQLGHGPGRQRGRSPLLRHRRQPGAGPDDRLRGALRPRP
ncbi:MAG: hypothetical protein MZV65_16040 [Chromatiales bacterium]|nr:hypothetical protein [Chromatiales bacterium]